ncbi:MAG TPA: DUF58 domain-containing protein [Cyclobacteriaceae bacterium]|jgi:uncharacterized protein (DUF58 family)
MKIDLNEIRNFANLELLAKQLVEGFITGLHKSPYHGFSVEFAEHRLYNTGESTRHIDWKVFAKTDRLYVKRYEEETNLRCQIVIDNSSSMHYPVANRGKLLFSVLAAASLAYLLQKQRDAVGITTFSDKIDLQTQIKSTSAHLNKLFIELEHLLTENIKLKTTNVAPVLHEIADKNHKRSLVIILSDMFDRDTELDEIFKALQHLKHNNHEVLLFHVTDQQTEYRFEFEDRPYEFIDLESGEKLKINPTQVKDMYTRKVGEYYNELKLRCGQLKIDFIEADIRDGFNNVLKSYLIKRSRMK